MMPNPTYVITVDMSDPTLDADALRNFIKSSPAFDDWWNYIPFVFLVTSSLEPKEISDLLRKVIGKTLHFVMKVDPAHADGLLPGRSWSWIKRHSKRQKLSEDAHQG